MRLFINPLKSIYSFFYDINIAQLSIISMGKISFQQVFKDIMNRINNIIQLLSFELIQLNYKTVFT